MSCVVNLEVKNLKKYYGDVHAVDGVSININKGETISIIGPSGAGKSAFLRSVIQLENPDSGYIYVDNEIIFGIDEKTKKQEHIEHTEFTRRKSKIGMIFQRFNLFPHKTALENVSEAPIVVNNINKKEAIEEAKHLLNRVGLSDKYNSYPNEISGGQQQRVAIARALAMKPEILLCDEPTSSLDPELVGEVLNVLKELSEENMTMIVVSHEMSFAREVSDRVAFMDMGKIIDIGKSDDFFTKTNNDRVREFLKKIL